MTTDIHWNIDGNVLYMEAVDAENGQTLGQHEEALQFWTSERINGSFDAEEKYTSEMADVDDALRDFAEYFKK